MELRVWVDGTQRVVCGVKLTTTCQEIVFALAHATQQAGRFTMIERWRNNERLLSPNEQPMVTLQRWGDRMNEVEFILRKTSSDLPPNTTQQPPSNTPAPPPPPQLAPRPPSATTTNHLTQQLQKIPSTNNITASPSLMRPRYADEQTLSNSSPSMINGSFNGYSVQPNEAQYQNSSTLTNQQPLGETTKNYPYEDLYSTINKKRNSQPPPAVPAKPRVLHSMANVSQTINNAQLNYYHQNRSPINHMYPNSIRPRHPPGYLDYLEAMASRNSLPLPLNNYLHQSQNFQSNIYPRSYDIHQQQHRQQLYQNGASPANSSTTSNKYFHHSDQHQTNHLTQSGSDANTAAGSLNQFNNGINSKLGDSGLVINRGSAVNIKTPSNSQNQSISNQSKVGISDDCLNTSAQSNASSVSQMGLDMLRVIEEQKKVLINQKNELERLDNDQQYWEAKQNSEEAELINRVESEICQLEELWKENQAQIKKLENQNFEDELKRLKSEQVKMEAELEKQRTRLIQREKDIDHYNGKIEQLEKELASHESVVESSQHEEQETKNKHTNCSDNNGIENSTGTTNDLELNHSKQPQSNGSTAAKLLDDEQVDRTRSSDEDECDEDSGGDASDDPEPRNSDNNKLRTARDVAYVEKRGLISGIRSLKLDKSRTFNRHIDAGHQSANHVLSSSTELPKNTNDKTSSITNNNITENECRETSNGHFHDTTAKKNFEFLMTL